MTLEERFVEAAARSKTLPPQSNTALLDLYKFFKQGKMGDVSGPEPGAFDFKGKAKYDAWSTVKGMSKEEAMEKYIETVDRLASGSA